MQGYPLASVLGLGPSNLTYLVSRNPTDGTKTTMISVIGANRRILEDDALQMVGMKGSEEAVGWGWHGDLMGG